MNLMHGDCLELLWQIPDASVDMILCDLPYGTTACTWDSVIPFALLWEHYRRIIKGAGAIVLMASQPFTSAMIASNFKDFRYCWVWEKSKASNFVHAKYQPLKAHEDIAVFSLMPATNNLAKRNMNFIPQKTNGKPYNKGLHIGAPQVLALGCTGAMILNESGDRNPRSVQYFRTAESEGKHHPTQKPVALMEYLIRTYTNTGDTVLDNCMGSGTTGVACMNTGREFIGMEQYRPYFEVAERRIYEAWAATLTA